MNMNIPKSEPLPDDPERLPPARRRRARRLLAPLDIDDRAAFLDALAHRTSPTFDFFLFSLISGVVLALGYILDAPAVVLAGALLAPLMAPLIGVCLGTMVGSVRFFLRSFVGFLIGSALVMASGAGAGILSGFWKPGLYYHAHLRAQLSWPDISLLALGAIFTAASLVHEERNPGLPRVASVALAYELFAPLAVAGLGLGAGIPYLWPDGLVVFVFHLALAGIIGSLTLAVLGFRPLTLFGYTLGAAVSLLGVILVLGLSGAGAVLAHRSPFLLRPGRRRQFHLR